MTPVGWTHEGVIITINNEGRFIYPGHQFPMDSLAEAKRQITAINKSARHSTDKAINLMVLNVHGNPVTLRRIHEGTGRWLTEPKDQEGPFYLNIPEVAALLKDARALEVSGARKQRAASAAGIHYRMNYGHQSADDIEQVTANFLQGCEAAKVKWASSIRAR